MPKMNRQYSFTNFFIQAHTLTFLSSSTPSYSFHGSNSSHSKDSGQGGRTYHVPNYATSYANERSHLISVTFDEDKNAKKTIIVIVFMFLFLLGSSICVLTRGLEGNFLVFRAPGAVEQQETVVVEPPDLQFGGDVRSSTAGPTENDTFDDQWVGDMNDELALGDGEGFSDRTTTGSGLYWDELQGSSHCVAYGTRRYTARLRNVPFWANRTRACMETPIQINGAIISSPDGCEVTWLFSGVRGHWHVNFRERDCSPAWGNFRDKGCIKKASQKRLFRARLWNVRKGEDRMLLCESAPAHVAGMYRSKPDRCEDQGIWGTYGFWIVEDPKC
ncbi:hypothetical protein P691DRAFT_495714 [Macrolepiota fuliginosa MF-IS2]|uniref:Uncharacterized protein n=1 Tax=Macrolepiota fuliginosa MF-IS2 TaxID=1400762 RepID=A0A9P6C307_9AGAR|nr:hypothetical protein P691DRAFT_495714 [Macrolepiota fuliginosa MF-IS2]